MEGRGSLSVPPPRLQQAGPWGGPLQGLSAPSAPCGHPPDPGHRGARDSCCPGTDQPLSHAQWVGSSAVCGGQWLPCAWRGGPASGREVEGSPPAPSPPIWASEPHRPFPPAPGSPRRRAASEVRPARQPGTPAYHLRPRRGAIADSQNDFGGSCGHLSRPQRAPAEPRSPAPYANDPAGSQWRAERGPPRCAAASGRKGGWNAPPTAAQPLAG